MFGFGVDSADGEGLRPALLRTLTELYVLRPSHSPDEEQHFTELALRLIDAVDMPERIAAAERLVDYGNAPQAVLQRLADRLSGSEPEPAPVEEEAVSRTAPPLDLTPAVPDELTEIFFAATGTERRLILEVLAYAPIAPTEPLHAVHAYEAARRLEIAALARSSYEFALILVGTLGIGQALATRIATDLSGEPLVVAAHALDMPRDVLERIVLFLNPAIGEDVQRVYDLVQLYDELPPDTAKRLLAIWRKTSVSRAPLYQPLYHDDEERRARTQPATHARRTGQRMLDRVRGRVG